MNPINPDTTRHLSYAKSLYLHALQHSDSDSLLDRAIAVMNFDGAIETSLYALMDYVGAEVSEKATYHEMLRALKQELKETSLEPALLQEVSINNLHRARNDAQHHGIIPSIDDIERYKTITYQVLSNLSENILKKNFDEISLAELIQDNMVKILYKNAEVAYFSTDYETALVCVAGAFERAKNIEQGKLFGSGIMGAMISKAMSSTNNPKDNELLDIIIQELEILKLSLNYKKYQKYRESFHFTLEPFTTVSEKTPSGIIDEIRKLRQTQYPRGIRQNQKK